jgi:hypothetical protein
MRCLSSSLMFAFCWLLACAPARDARPVGAFPRFDSVDRQRILLQESGRAELILVGTMLDTTILASPDNDIRTRYTVRVDRIVKGSDATSWRRIGDLAVVETTGYPCGHDAIASRSWGAFLTELK